MKRTLQLLATGLALGVAVYWAFDFTLEATSSESFCLSCHEMQIPKDRLMTTAHGRNEFGVVAECSDCHLPKAFLPKIGRKIEASREVWGHLVGIIDTPEKYEAHRNTMRDRELARMVANDSMECRDCHRVERWILDLQSKTAGEKHLSAIARSKTCVDCHDDVGHPVYAVSEDNPFDF